MDIYWESNHIPQPNFQFPNWSDTPSSARFSPHQNFPPPPEEVHPQPELDTEYQQKFPQLSDDINGSHLKSPLCPQCQGQKYNFTAYFHSRIFPHPPHNLLAYAEKSYVLKNRLHNLLVSYVMHGEDFAEANLNDLEQSIKKWRLDVEELLASVRGRHSHRADVLLEEMIQWADDNVRLIWQHICGLRRLDGFEKHGPRRRSLKATTEGFRKIWEKIWIALSDDCSPGS